MTASLTATLWADVEDVHAAILAHPFVTGLTDGTLARESFRHYIVQDAHYLRTYSRALAVCAAKAPTAADTVMFAQHAGGAIAAEQDLHASLMADLGLSAETAAKEPVAPTTVAYTSYLLATCYRVAGQCAAVHGGGEGPRGEARQGPSRAL
jgi:thiaminase/transcriptional activator TenA